jgi:hypothetical protein
MTHEELKTALALRLQPAVELLLEDETKANYVSVLAKMWSELEDYPESELEWLDEAELDEMILTVYYALSRARHAITSGVNKEVKKYVKAADKDWQINKEISIAGH